MKKKGVCSKCGGIRVGRLARVVDRDERGAWDRPHERRIAAVGRQGVFGRGWQLVAETEAYVCADCGYFEEYVVEPGRVSWDDVDGFEWIRTP